MKDSILTEGGIDKIFDNIVSQEEGTELLDSIETEKEKATQDAKDGIKPVEPTSDADTDSENQNENTEEENDTLPESSPEDKQTKEDPSQKGENTKAQDIPLNKNPRFQEIIKSNQELKERLAQLEKINDEKKEKVEDAPLVIPSWFQAQYGNNQQAYKSFLGSVKQAAREENEKLTSDKNSKLTKQQQAEDESQQKVVDELQVLRDEGCDFEEKDLLKVALDYRPIKEDKSIDLKKAYKIYSLLRETKDSSIQIQKKVNLQLKKEISNKSNTDSKPIEQRVKSISDTDWSEI